MRAGLSPTDVGDLDEGFGGRIDLQAHLTGGRSLVVWLRGTSIVAARVKLAGRREVLAGRLAGQPAGPWYDDRGLSLAGPILARPLALAAITSRFGERLHPITGRRARHVGLDYGAVEGTPVFAVGDGKIRACARSASAGLHVVIDHAGGYESRYLHLRAVAADLVVGARVKQGQTIAFVGRTGRATGPHLHYELRIAGIPVDPLTTLPIPSTALGSRALQAHRAFLADLPY